jgi:hypothetical protein
MSAPKRQISEERERLAASLAASLKGPGGGYQLSSAFSAPERRRFLGLWSIAEHLVEGRDYLEIFAGTALRGAALAEPSYVSSYDFREAVCVKRVRIDGIAELPEGRTPYSYRMSVAASWEIGRGFLLVRAELGYQSTSLGGASAAVKELAAQGAASRVGYRFEDDGLVLEEGSDVKRLIRGGG